jgi:hypothetical protein
MIVPGDGFSITKGTPKTISKKADSGSQITSYFCGDCGSTLYRETGTFGDNKIVKVGVMDDIQAFDDAKPVLELYVKDRVSWVPEFPGADQKQSMS